MKDLLYFFDKTSSRRINGHPAFLRHELGEVQTNFNMAITIDGSKDSVSFEVLSYVDYEIQPFTIVFHDATKTFWIISSDKIKRYQNESGFMYVHKLNCVGAIELLNARDLTDCGFRAKKYTIDSFAKRLISLSNFEMDFLMQYSTLDKDEVVDYLKTFENYSLLSALREFFNGYNSDVKMSFSFGTYNDETYITTAYLKIIPKNGNPSHIININTLKDIRESKELQQNSFGTTVVSNAENVVSTKPSVYPLVGTTTLSSLERLVVEQGQVKEGAVIRLPTPAYKVNKLTIVSPAFTLSFQKNSGERREFSSIWYNAYNEYGVNNLLTRAFNTMEERWGSTIIDQFRNQRDFIIEQIKKATSFELYDGFLYDAMNDEFKYPQNAPTGMKLIEFENRGWTPIVKRKVILTDKVTHDSLNHPYQGIYWERGSDLIRDFTYFSRDGVNTDVAKDVNVSFSILGTDLLISIVDGSDTYKIYVNEWTSLSPEYMDFIVDYIPMSDMKIKVDNLNNTKDIQLYNQNGKLTDSVALSKMLNSYSNEISTDKITRYGDFYSFDSIPEVGYLVDYNGTLYVINHISLEFYQNEQTNNEVSYKIEGEFTMSKYVAVKSLLVNANSNIRDYGIPQTNNVKRKQLYRDFWTLRYELDPLEDNDYYATITDILAFPYYTDVSKEYMAFIECSSNYPTYTAGTDTPTGTISSCYYQLSVARFELKKQVTYLVDFKDNNIIGYDSQNVASGFDVSRILQPQSNNVNTPIGYTNELGEVTGINLQFTSSGATSFCYSKYLEDEGHPASENYLSKRVFLDEEGKLYALAENNSSFWILEPTYNKDALEVPVFEYCCQICNSPDVLIGNNILDFHTGEDIVMLYGFYVGNKNSLNETNALKYVETPHLSGTKWTLNNGAELFMNDDQVVATFYYDTTYDTNTGEIDYNRNSPQTIYAHRDILVYRVLFNKTTQTVVSNEIIFIAKDTPSSSWHLELYWNHYKKIK
jgi:hypothetical protein